MGSKHFVKLAYPIDDPDAFEIVDTSMNEAGIAEVLEAFIRDSAGKGDDLRVANDLDVYEITVTVDLSHDDITVKSNCGQKGLELGILMDIFTRMTKDQV